MNNDQQVDARYVLLTQSILGNKSLTSNEKLVLARISGFERFFESNETTAEFLGISERTVHYAKKHLKELGYIVEINDTGHGKVLVADLLRGAKSAGEGCKNCSAGVQNLQTENKERIKEEQKGDEQKFGRDDINFLVALWEAKTGISIKGQKQQRYALANLIKSHGYEATESLIQLVGETRRVNDRFAPQIATPRELVGKFSKLERLLLWQERRKLAQPFGQPKLPSYKAPDPEPEISDEERARVTEQIKAARKKLGFTKEAA